MPLPFIPVADAHVKYVLEESEVVTHSGSDWTYVLSPLSDGSNIVLMVITILVVLLAIFLINKVKPFSHRAHFIQHQAESYQNIISWMMRLSIGIALIGAGTSGFLISPAIMATNNFVGIIQISLGFMLLIGLFIPIALAGTIIIFIAGLMRDIYLIGNSELLAAAIALLLLGNPWPGLDHLLGINFPELSKKWHHLVPIILRLGLGSAMVYLAFAEKFLNPHQAALVVNNFNLDQAIPVSPAMWVLSTGIIEAFLGILILLGFYTRAVAAVTFIVLSMSFFYFNEAVYSHITLFGILSVLFATGSGELSIDHFRSASRKRNTP